MMNGLAMIVLKKQSGNTAMAGTLVKNLGASRDAGICFPNRLIFSPGSAVVNF
jgi:hypothetical protein